MLASSTKIESLLFYRDNISSILIAHFLNKSLKKFKADNTGKQIVIFLDNESVYRTTLMKKLTGFHEIALFFPPPHNTYINMIEYVFRQINSGFKNEYSMG
jgi:transposase